MLRTRERRLKRMTWSFKLKLPSLSIMDPTTVLWILCLMYSVVVIFLMTGPVFRAHRFICTTNAAEPCPDFIVPELAKSKDIIIFFVQTDRILSRLEANVPKAESISVIREFPGTLHAVITWQHPIANLSIPASTSAFIVGSTGEIVTVVDTPDPTLPLIVASSAADLIISDRLTDPSLNAALEILKSFDGASLKTPKIDVISSQDIRADLSNNTVAVFTSLKPVRPQVDKLQLILSQATMNPIGPFIDLRYDRPTLKKSL